MNFVVSIREIIRDVIIKIKYLFMTRVYKMNISKTAKISIRARIDKTNPNGIYIGEYSYISSGALILSHDFSRSLHDDTKIGKRCFVGANAIVMCGITIGDEVIVGAGSVVTKDVPSGCVVAGNPARIIREGIHTDKYGRILCQENESK